MAKTIRSLCYFSERYSDKTKARVDALYNRLVAAGFEIQTQRIVLPEAALSTLLSTSSVAQWDGDGYIAIGPVSRQRWSSIREAFYSDLNLSCHLDLTQQILAADVDRLFEIIATAADKTFNFSYCVNNPPSSPFFPSARWQQDGFAIGLQSTDLLEAEDGVADWMRKMRHCWQQIVDLFADDGDFLGIDSSIAPLYHGSSSLVNFIRRQCGSFEQAVTTPIFTQLSQPLREYNPRPVGLCGLMLPCLEDFELAEEYQAGRFTIERNLFLALHSGLGIDTYPIGIDQSPARVFEILSLLRQLSLKYHKPLSARFISDGQASINGQSDFDHPFLQDVIIRPL